LTTSGQSSRTVKIALLADWDIDQGIPLRGFRSRQFYGADGLLISRPPAPSSTGVYEAANAVYSHPPSRLLRDLVSRRAQRVLRARLVYIYLSRGVRTQRHRGASSTIQRLVAVAEVLPPAYRCPDRRRLSAVKNAAISTASAPSARMRVGGAWIVGHRVVRPCRPTRSRGTRCGPRTSTACLVVWVKSGSMEAPTSTTTIGGPVIVRNAE